MKYKKLVVMICLASNFFAMSELAFAKKKKYNPINDIKKIFIPKEPRLPSLPDLPYIGDIRDITRLPGPSPTPWDGSDPFKNIPLANEFRPISYLTNSLVLEAVKGDLPWLRDIHNVELHSLMTVVNQLVTDPFVIKRLTRAQILAEITEIISILKEGNNLHLLNLVDPNWEQKAIERLAPKVNIGGSEINLHALLPKIQEQIGQMITSSDSDLWKLADHARSSATVIQQEMFLNMEAGISPAVSTVAAAVAADKTEDGTSDDWEIYDDLCGYRAVPLELGSISFLVPVDRIVPATCGGAAATADGWKNIYASEVVAWRQKSAVDNVEGAPNLARHTSAHTYYKEPYGVHFDFRIMFMGTIPVEPPITLSVTPHVRFPIAWSKPLPSKRTVSQAGGGTIIKNAKDHRFFFSPEFEVSIILANPTLPTLINLPTNIEFPLVAKQGGAGANGTVLQQIIVRTGLDIGIRKLDPNDNLIMKQINALLRYCSLLEEDAGVAELFAEINPEFNPEGGIPAAAAREAEVVLHRIMGSLGLLAALADIPALSPTHKLSNEDQADVVTATATMPFLISGGLGFFRDLGLITKITKLAGILNISEITLAKLQINFGFLNARYAAALAKGELPAADVGYELVRPGVPDWISLSLSLVPQVTQTWYGFNDGVSAAGVQLWGPYSFWTPSMAWAGTLAGSLYLNNGSDQYEPMGVK